MSDANALAPQLAGLDISTTGAENANTKPAPKPESGLDGFLKAGGPTNLIMKYTTGIVTDEDRKRIKDLAALLGKAARDGTSLPPQVLLLASDTILDLHFIAEAQARGLKLQNPEK